MVVWMGDTQSRTKEHVFVCKNCVKTIVRIFNKEKKGSIALWF